MIRTVPPNPSEPFTIIREAVYEFVQPSPVGRQGHFYRVLWFVKDIPSYQPKVLVHALTGPDAGTVFTCTYNNFATRYRHAPDYKPTVPFQGIINPDEVIVAVEPSTPPPTEKEIHGPNREISGQPKR